MLWMMGKGLCGDTVLLVLAAKDTILRACSEYQYREEGPTNRAEKSPA